MNWVHPRRTFSHTFWLSSWTPSPVSPGWQVLCSLSAAKYHRVPLRARIPAEPGCGVSTLFHPRSIPLDCRSCVWGVIVEHASQGAAAVFYSVISTALQLILGCECNFSVSAYFTPALFPQRQKRPITAWRAFQRELNIGVDLRGRADWLSGLCPITWFVQSSSDVNILCCGQSQWLRCSSSLSELLEFEEKQQLLFKEWYRRFLRLTL